MFAAGIIKNGNGEAESLADIEKDIVFMAGVELSVQHDSPAAVSMAAIGLYIKP